MSASPRLSRFDELDTPCLILDAEMLEQNLRSMQNLVTSAGRNLRPHVKTHKCSTLARRQLESGAVGVCVAKVSEAAALMEAGISNILITGPVVAPMKMARLVGLAIENPDVMVVVDSEQGVLTLDAVARGRRQIIQVLLDVDVGLGRTGISPDQAEALAARVSACQNLHLCGIQAYAGHLQHVENHAERREASKVSLAPAVALFHRLQRNFPNCTVFSASGTGTVCDDLSIAKITEVQPGSYVCMDTEYLNIGSVDDPHAFTTYAPALRVLTSVVSHRGDGSVTVDAGLKAIYRDGPSPRVFSPAYAGWTYDWFGDEYGRLIPPPGAEPPPLGSTIELIPSHCDPTINLFDCFHLVRDQEVIDCWAIDLRGCSQ